jgi:hypothetical protein
MDDLVSLSASNTLSAPPRRRLRPGTLLGCLALLSGPFGFWVAQMLAGIVLFPLLFLTEHLGAPYGWWQASLWLATAALAWGILTWRTLRGTSLPKLPFLLIAAAAMAWAVIPWVLLTLAMSGPAD